MPPMSALLLIPPLALAGAIPAALADSPFDGGGIKRMVRLPANGLQAIETEDGTLLVMSDNGRYAIRGELVDLWHGEKLHSLDAIEALVGRVDLARLHLDPADLGALDHGAGADVVAFVDPDCPHCEALYRAITAQGLAEHYRFRLVPLPLGEKSQRAVLALDCLATENPGAAREALLTGSARDLPAPSGTCGQEPAQRALIAARLIGVPGTPYLIAPDGRTTVGVPTDFAGWLAGRPVELPRDDR